MHLNIDYAEGLWSQIPQENLGSVSEFAETKIER
jgi:hypothetical protein